METNELVEKVNDAIRQLKKIGGDNALNDESSQVIASGLKLFWEYMDQVAIDSVLDRKAKGEFVSCGIIKTSDEICGVMEKIYPLIEGYDPLELEWFRAVRQIELYSSSPEGCSGTGAKSGLPFYGKEDAARAERDVGPFVEKLLAERI